MAFAGVAARLAGLVPRALGWRPAEFWDATPAELAAIFAAEDGGDPAPLSRTEFNSLMEREGDG
ncbi:MAG: phage tail assembly chaperone [Croceibacterium sp.]